MNNKIMDYDKAVKRLKECEIAMRYQKKLLRLSKDAESQRYIQSAIFRNRSEINLLLSIVASEKKARKLWVEAKYYREMMSGVSSTKRGPID
jgi:hypothetical protein|tara:strand:- start:41 stop:316 length:276 start_codon:yes stop_codon:yes gene_type:complete